MKLLIIIALFWPFNLRAKCNGKPAPKRAEQLDNDTERWKRRNFPSWYNDRFNEKDIIPSG